MENCRYNEKKLTALRDKVKQCMSEKRFSHTLGVEEECEYLASLFGLSENDALRLRAAALMHDITKERSVSEQKEICKKYGVFPDFDIEKNEKIIHGFTASLVTDNTLNGEIDEYSDEGISRAIRLHTVGDENMSLFDRLLYLADYIEPTRRYDDCVMLRKMLHGGADKILSGTGENKKNGLYALLTDTLIKSFDLTIGGLIDGGYSIFPAAVISRNALLEEKKAYTQDRKTLYN